MSMKVDEPSRKPLIYGAGLLGIAASLGGCAGAPSLTVAGAYFPAWLACGLLGLFAAAVFRAVFVATGLAQVLPMQFFVCLSLGALVGALAWVLWVGF